MPWTNKATLKHLASEAQTQLTSELIGVLDAVKRIRTHLQTEPLSPDTVETVLRWIELFADEAQWQGQLMYGAVLDALEIADRLRNQRDEAVSILENHESGLTHLSTGEGELVTWLITALGAQPEMVLRPDLLKKAVYLLEYIKAEMDPPPPTVPRG